jgi:uncharacterized protein
MTCSIIVLAKAPLPGYAKTRLAKKIGDVAAAKLATRMLQAAVEQAVLAKLGPVQLCCAPDSTHPAFIELQQRYGITLGLQGEGDLGERMQRALQAALQQHDYALLTGTDAPGLDAHYLQQAAAALKTTPVVFAPVADGGYALVGVSRAAQPGIAALFSNITWSTSVVLQQSRERLAAQGIKHTELAQLHDIDEPEDLIHLPPHWRD